MNKWYLYNLESIQENETHKVLWDFEIQTDHLISGKWPNLVIINKKKKRTGWMLDFAIPADHSKIQRKRK